MASLMRDFPSLVSLSDFSKLSKDDRSHLKNVYTSLSLTLLSATAGSALMLQLGGMYQALGFLSALLAAVLMLALRFTGDTGKNRPMRLGLLLAFGFFDGVALGPLLNRVADIDPSLISAALGGTVIIFTCFSLSALYAEQRSMLYLGGYLMSGLFMLLMAGLVNIFLGSLVIFEIQLYLGLAIFSAFILYDTQLIIEKSRRGDKDYIWHSVKLFMDFLDVFRHLLVIMAKDNKKKRRD